MGSATGPGLGRRIGKLIGTGGASVVFLTRLAAAQSATEYATQACNTDGYQFGIAIVLVAGGVVLLTSLLGAFAGTGLLQLSFAQKLFAKMGRKGIVYSFGGVGLLVLALGLIRIAAGAMSVASPSACTGGLF